MEALLVAEFNSIPVGIKILDTILKKSNIKIYKAGVTCPGKYFFIVYGLNGDINYCSNHIDKNGKFEIISGVSKKLIEILGKNKTKDINDAVGIVEFFTISESVKALDMILKSSLVEAIRLRLGNGVAGKSYFIVSGDISSINEAIIQIEKNSKYKSYEIINNPSKDLLMFI